MSILSVLLIWKRDNYVIKKSRFTFTKTVDYTRQIRTFNPENRLRTTRLFLQAAIFTPSTLDTHSASEYLSDGITPEVIENKAVPLSINMFALVPSINIKFKIIIVNIKNEL